MATNDGGPAFPIPMLPGEYYKGDGSPDGMALRDWFAGQALAGYFAAPHTPHQNAADAGVAAYLYEIADAMIAERAKAVG